MAVLLLIGFSASSHAADLIVSAAASLTNALRDVAPLFEAAQPGTRVQFNFGASNALLQQLAKGAPADVLVSADEETMNQAQIQGLVHAAARRDVVSNRLVLVVPARSTRVPVTLSDLKQDGYPRIAIGVASLPAGRYARGVLEAAGLMAALEPRFVGAQTVRQALDYVARAEVDAGFVYATDAALMPTKVKVALDVPTAAPIRYPAAPVAASPNAALAQRFVDFLLAAPAQAVFARHGFGRP